MKVGDLVRVYHFSHKARSYAQMARVKGLPSSAGFKGDINAHHVGLIVGATDNDPKYRRVLRTADGEREVYNVDRIEVIA